MKKESPGGQTAEARAKITYCAYCICECGAEGPLELLKDCQEELRLIRMKDTAAVYDPTLRSRISIALAGASSSPAAQEEGK